MKAVNLIPADQRGGAANAKGRSEGGAFIVLGALAGMALLALLYGMAHSQISSRRGEAATLGAQAQAAQAQATALAPYTSFASLQQQRAQAISQLVDTRFDWAHAFHEIGRVLPYDASLTSVHGTIAMAGVVPGAPATPAPTATTTPSASASAAPAVTSATPAGSTPTFTLGGCATSQSEVARTLLRLRLIDGVTDVELQSSTKPTSGGSSNSSASGACPGNDPAFAVQVSFQALPAPSPTGSSAAGSAGATPAAASTTGAGAQPVSSTVQSGGS